MGGVRHMRTTTTNSNKRPLTSNSMPPAGDEHAKLKTCVLSRLLNDVTALMSGVTKTQSAARSAALYFSDGNFKLKKTENRKYMEVSVRPGVGNLWYFLGLRLTYLIF